MVLKPELYIRRYDNANTSLSNRIPERTEGDTTGDDTSIVASFRKTLFAAIMSIDFRF